MLKLAKPTLEELCRGFIKGMKCDYTCKNNPESCAKEQYAARAVKRLIFMSKFNRTVYNDDADELWVREMEKEKAERVSIAQDADRIRKGIHDSIHSFGTTAQRLARIEIYEKELEKLARVLCAGSASKEVKDE